MTVATALALEVVDREASVMPFPLQDTKRDHTAGAVMEWRSRGARLTARQAQWLLTGANDFFTL
jgi:hypothetical protein